MNFLERTLAEIAKARITKNKFLTDLKLGKNSFIDWKNYGNIPSGETLSKIADYFNVTTDYLLCRTDDPTPPGGKKEPAALDSDELEELIDLCRQLSPRQRTREKLYLTELIARGDG